MAILAGFFGTAAGVRVRVRVVLLGALDLVGVEVGNSTVGSSLADSSSELLSRTSDERVGCSGGLVGSRSVKISGLSVEARAWRTASESLRFSSDSRL
jgi:hypothetical protein